jgi:guanylate kinase
MFGRKKLPGGGKDTISNLKFGDKVDLVSVFVLVPSIPDLEARLRTRAQDSDDIIRARMSKAADEMSHWAEYDYVVINREVLRAFEDICAILAAERLKRERQTGCRHSCARCKRSCRMLPGFTHLKKNLRTDG